MWLNSICNNRRNYGVSLVNKISLEVCSQEPYDFNRRRFSLDFLFNGCEYDKFIKMDGTFSGVDTLGKTTVVTLLNTDIITIIESDYEEVKILYDKKCSDDYDSYLAKERERSKAYEEKQKQKKEKQASAKEIAERIANIRNIEAIEVEGKSEETETQKRRGFWYCLFHRKNEVSK